MDIGIKFSFRWARASASIKANLIRQHQVEVMAPSPSALPYSLSPQLGFHYESEWEES